jgi:hypothetical protein
MNFKKFSPFLNLLSLVLVIYVIHSFIFYLFNIDTNTFHYSLEALYLFFFLLSTIIFKVLVMVKEKSFDNVGMSFLLVTSVKVIFCYLIVRPLLNISKPNSPIEKANFFVLFIVFLAIETLFTIRLVNENEQTHDKR